MVKKSNVIQLEVKKKSFKAPPQKTPFYTIYTDGSFRLPKFGSWAFAMWLYGKPCEFKVELVEDSTINQMELLAIYKAMEHVPPLSRMVIYSDSMYAIRCVRDWAKGWARDNWVTATGQPVKNRELIIKILELQKTMTSVQLIHVKAHNGTVGNEFVDFLAQVTTYKAMLRWQESERENAIRVA